MLNRFGITGFVAAILDKGGFVAAILDKGRN
jgi:hypothetical protein